MIARFFLLLLPFLAACETKLANALPARDLKAEERYHKAGLVGIPDLQHASNWEKLIHVDMGVPSRKIEVQAGPGFTTVLIKELANRNDAESIAQGLRAYAEQNPEKYGPTKVEVKLVNAAPTINPFTLPSQSNPSTVSPESALPTL